MALPFSQLAPHLQIATVQKLDADDFLKFRWCSQASFQTTKFIKTKIFLNFDNLLLCKNDVITLKRRERHAVFQWNETLAFLKDAPICLDCKYLNFFEAHVEFLRRIFELTKRGTIRAPFLLCNLSCLLPIDLEKMTILFERLKVEKLRCTTTDFLSGHTVDEYASVINLFLHTKTFRQFMLSISGRPPKENHSLLNELAGHLSISNITKLDSEDKGAPEWAENLHEKLNLSSNFTRYFSYFIAQNSGIYILLCDSFNGIYFEKLKGETSEEAVEMAWISLKQKFKGTFFSFLN